MKTKMLFFVQSLKNGGMIIVRVCNVPKHVCNHLLGHAHSRAHRIRVGIVIMAFGVFIPKISIGGQFLHWVFDGLGGLVHAIGALPIVEGLEKKEGIKIEEPVEERVEEVV